MDTKYSELVSFFRDNGKEVQLQKAVNEYQFFSQTLQDIQFCLEFEPEKVHARIREKLDD